MPFLFDPPETPSLPIIGKEERFPIRRIFCVGRNYAEHTKEMGGNPEKEDPFFFTKPADAIVQNNSKVPYPLATNNFHFEMELVIAIGGIGQKLSKTDAEGSILGYASGIDLTRRDLQSKAKETRRPWDASKGFDQSAPCSAIQLEENTGDLSDARISLSVNEDTKQDALISDMIWNPIEIVAFLSELFEIRPGDLIYTGTPAGVGAIKKGDKLVGSIDGLEDICIEIT